MRLDQITGWQLLGAQVVALAIVATTLWLLGLGFHRSRVMRGVVLIVAPLLGAMTALGILNTDEAIVSSYLFAVCLFLLGTLAMSVLLLAAIPQTRAVALGGLAIGGLIIVAFILTYYVAFTFGRPRWFQPPSTANRLSLARDAQLPDRDPAARGDRVWMLTAAGHDQPAEHRDCSGQRGGAANPVRGPRRVSL